MNEETLVMVCVTGQKNCDRLIQMGQQIAKPLAAALKVVHVAHADAPLLGNPAQGEALNYLYGLSCEAGAEMIVLRAADPLERLIQYATEQHAAHIVLGASQPSSNTGRDVASVLTARLPQSKIHVVYA